MYMAVIGIDNQNNSNFQSDLSRDSDFRRELAGIRRDILSGVFSDSERSSIQNLLKQAEKALDDGNTFAARGILNEAGKAFENRDDNHSSGHSLSLSEVNISQHEVDKHTYQDDSADPSVSFKYPREINEYQAEIAVSAHEGEHVRDAVFKAQNEKTLANVQVRYHYGYDSKGKRYIKGGTTKVSFPTRNIHVKLNQARSHKINKKI